MLKKPWVHWLLHRDTQLQDALPLPQAQRLTLSTTTASSPRWKKTDRTDFLHVLRPQILQCAVTCCVHIVSYWLSHLMVSASVLI